ncbi:MAG: helicase, partial [Prevotellaceae bacterium]|nr:helicase [Prevotellaceae bacterium]
VYTPVECVDFILHSVDEVLQSEFGAALTHENVHVLDPFTGTGTFITRLLQSGLIRPEDMVRKYRHEIHANELVLLAYYIADVNIESVFQEVCPQPEYLPYDGICLTDTFQLGENSDDDIFKHFFKENTEAVEAQRRTPIRVIIGNPPYSIGQKSANDNAQNQSYPLLDQRIAETYVAGSTAGLSKGIYDSYIRAYRWATDRLSPEDGGVIAFISNGTWLDGNSHDGFRASLEKEFDKIYVYNLRGNARTSGELRKREGDGIFGMGSRTPIAITLLVRYPEGRRLDQCQIFYHDIGDYLNREEKLRKITQAQSYRGLDWTPITPNEKHDWINQRDGLFDTLLPLA